ncbi:MAG: sulfite exporter TauE/SafE family protein [Pseudomonadota bacterium]
MNEISFISAFVLGLAGAGHCLGMCGGISSALGFGGHHSNAVSVSYHLGRILSYSLLGAVLGFAAGSIEFSAWTMSLRYLAGLLLIAMGFYIGNWWHGIVLLEKAGASLWQPVQRFSARWLPVRHWWQALALGAGWGLMPCGLIYSALAWATTAQHAATSALMMLFFGLGTLPAMLTAHAGAAHLQSFLRQRGFKVTIALALIVSGIYTLAITATHENHAHHTDPALHPLDGAHYPQHHH